MSLPKKKLKLLIDICDLVLTATKTGQFCCASVYL